MKRFVGFTLVGVGVSFGLLGACSSSTSEPATVEDSGIDGSTDSGVKKDTSVKDTGNGTVCADASLQTVVLPDASLGDGGSLGLCFTCSRAHCGDQVKACDNDCDCKNALVDFYACQGAGKSVSSCAAPVLALQDPAGGEAIALVQCAATSCNTECNASAFQ